MSARRLATHPSEAALVAKLLVDQDAAAFAELVEFYQQPVRQYCRRLCKQDIAMADDIAQDTFLQALNKIKLFAGSGSFVGWLFRIAYYQYLQMLRAKKAFDELDENDTNSSATNSSDTNFASQCQQFSQMQKRDLEKALEFLTLNERSCITLQFSFGYSQQEIAQLNNMPLGTVKSYVKRGKDKLTQLLNCTTASMPTENRGAA